MLRVRVAAASGPTPQFLSEGVLGLSVDDAHQHEYDCIVLDLMLLCYYGLGVCRYLRAAGVCLNLRAAGVTSAGIVMTATSQEVDTAIGLGVGAEQRRNANTTRAGAS